MYGLTVPWVRIPPCPPKKRDFGVTLFYFYNQSPIAHPFSDRYNKIISLEQNTVSHQDNKIQEASMTSVNIFSYLPLFAASLYTLLLVISFVRRSQDEQQSRWFLIFLIASIIWEFLLFFDADLSLPPNFPLKALLVGTLFLGMTTAVYVDWPKQRQWFLFGVAAILLAIAADIFLPNQTITTPIANATPTYRGIVSFLVWFLLTSFVFLRTWLNYRTTQFPWHANRLLFWAIGLFITFTGEAFLFFLWTGLNLTGQIIRFIGVLALAYAVTSYRVFDVRTRFQKGMALFIITIISALPMLGAIWAVEQIGASQKWESSSIILTTLLVIAVGFFLYQPFRNVIQRAVNHYFVGEGFDANQVLRNYSQATSRILDVNQLSLVILGTISELLETNHGTLLLITKMEEGYDIEVLPGIGQIPRQAAHFNAHSLFMSTLTQQHQPLLQYELDFNRQYANLTDEERRWLKTMAMDVFVPITAGEELEGLIAMGPKQSGLPYQPDELRLVQTLADQAVIALQNARLYSELETQNEQINRLNIDLVDQNERLEIMDQVKSDFITIASHELRTPLTQVKGYADILAAMNDENILSQEQTREIVSHINRATLQLEGLISAMLDASQLDVDGMQLTFMESSVDTIVRLAAEPLRGAMVDRRIQFERVGLTEIPPIHADFKRMVQSFTNLLGNAIKYTPDRGKVIVSARMVPVQLGEPEHVEIVVADTGIGIDPKYHELIFEKFFRIGDPQLHSTGSTKFKGAGPGLGLPIAKGVIEAHHGRIWVESIGEDEKRLPGSEFHIVLPLRPPQGRPSQYLPEKYKDHPAFAI